MNCIVSIFFCPRVKKKLTPMIWAVGEQHNPWSQYVFVIAFSLSFVTAIFISKKIPITMADFSNF